MRIHSLLFLGSLSSLALGGCASIWGHGSSESGSESVGWATSALVPIANCGELQQAIVDQAIRDMEKSIEQQRKYAHQSVGCHYGYYGSSDAGAASSYATSGAPSAATGASQSDSSEASTVSKTNNQVAGVDEADFVKNDNKYLYIAKGGKLRIVEAWPALTAHEIGSVEVPGTATKLFIDGDRALVYSSVPKQADSSDPYGYSYGSYYGGSGSSYGYEGASQGDGNATAITVFDISDRTAPKKVRSLELSGSLIAARLIGNAVHTVVMDSSLSPATTWDSYAEAITCDSTDMEIDIAYDNLLASNREKIRTASLTALPTVSDSVPGGTDPQACQGFYRSQLSDGFNVTSLISFDMSAESAHTSNSVVSRAGTVYASQDSLFMAVSHQQSEGYSWFEGSSEKEISTVHRFSLGSDPSGTRYQASGSVKGRVLNQFSLDAYNGALRIATTSGYLPSPDAHNTLTVLSQDGDALKEVGRIDNIAPSEDIRSVRFDGDRGFVVTFKKTDPLFVLGLADPTKPVVLGELKIPGFSTYMHLMDPTHLLAIGYDADDQGNFAWFAGINLQIFDVTDLSNPTLLHKETIGTRGSSSEALDDHLAFNYFKEKNLLALPMTICEGGTGGNYGTDMTFSGLMVYDVTAEAGFKLRGRVSHPYTAPSYEAGYYDGVDASCSNWWTNASSQVKRSVFMDNFVYSISDSLIKVNELSNLSTDVASVSY